MSDEQYERLARDTFFMRRMRSQGCIVDNIAGEELAGCPPEALPAIERVLLEAVEMEASNWTSVSRREATDLTHVVGAYLLIAARSNPSRAVRFISSATELLSDPSREVHFLISAPELLVTESLWAMEVFFRLMRDGTYNSDIAPPEEYRAFAEQASTSPSDAIREVAMGTLRRLRRAS